MYQTLQKVLNCIIDLINLKINCINIYGYNYNIYKSK